jgi:hypothetical protein
VFELIWALAAGGYDAVTAIAPATTKTFQMFFMKPPFKILGRASLFLDTFSRCLSSTWFPVRGTFLAFGVEKQH